MCWNTLKPIFELHYFNLAFGRLFKWKASQYEINTRPLKAVEQAMSKVSGPHNVHACVVAEIISVATKFIMAGSFEFFSAWEFLWCFCRQSCRKQRWERHISSKMNFSELFKQTNQLSRFSPNGKYMVSLWCPVSANLAFELAFDWIMPMLQNVYNFCIFLQGNCVQYRLLIRDVKTLQILQLYTCLDVVQCIEVFAIDSFHLSLIVDMYQDSSWLYSVCYKVPYFLE